MRTALELFEARVSQIDIEDDTIRITLSHALVHRFVGAPEEDAGSTWSQAVEIVLHGAEIRGEYPPLPNTVTGGYLDYGGSHHEFVPLPFKRRGTAGIFLEFADGSALHATGFAPSVGLLSAPVQLD